MKKPPVPEPPSPRKISEGKSDTFEKVLIGITIIVIVVPLMFAAAVSRRRIDNAALYPIHIHETEFIEERDRVERGESGYYTIKRYMEGALHCDYLWIAYDGGWSAIRDSLGNISIWSNKPGRETKWTPPQ